MVDVLSSSMPLTVEFPNDLLVELETLAKEKRCSVDEVVREACLAYTEPYFWDRSYKEWRRSHPNEPRSEFGIDGNELFSQEGRPS